MSATTHAIEVETDLAPVDEKKAPLPRDRVAREIFGRVGAIDDLLMEADGRSVPDSQALSTTFVRSLRTTGPIVLADLFAVVVSGLFARAVLLYLLPAGAEVLGISAMVGLVVMVAAYWLNGLYTEIWVHPAIEMRQLTHVTTIVLLAAAAGAFGARIFSMWCLMALPLAVVAVPLMRNVARRLCARHQWWGYPTLVIGNGSGVDAVARALLRDNHSGLRPVVLTDPKRECRVSVLPVVNDPNTLESIIRARSIRHAVISLPDEASSRLNQTVDRYSGLVPHLLVLSDPATAPTLWSKSHGCGRLSGIEVRNAVMLATLQIVKRAIDLSIAMAALCGSFPLLLALAVCVKVSSRGPVLYGHSRIGRHGRRFKAWKFRTMFVNGDALLREHLANDPAARAEWNRDHKLRDDPRVTAFGRMARKLSLDELPQLWNVLIGDMSLVGPRPIVDGEVWRYGETFKLYSTVKPGITGMWQVSGRNDIGYDERVLLDQFYIRHWSPWLDLYILAKTVITLINRSGAY